jgi:hypothetical protein
MGASISWNPQGLSRPVMGLPFTFRMEKSRHVNHAVCKLIFKLSNQLTVFMKPRHRMPPFMLKSVITSRRTHTLVMWERQLLAPLNVGSWLISGQFTMRWFLPQLPVCSKANVYDVCSSVCECGCCCNHSSFSFLCDVGTNPSAFPCKMLSYEYIAALNHWSSPSPCAVARPHFLVSVLLVKHFDIIAATFGKNMLCL